MVNTEAYPLIEEQFIDTGKVSKYVKEELIAIHFVRDSNTFIRSHKFR